MDLCVFTCGRLENPSSSQRACQRERFRSIRSRSTTGAGRLQLERGHARGSCHGLDLDEQPGRERYADRRPCRIRLREELAVDRVEAGEVAQVGEVGVHLQHVRELRPGGLQAGRQVLERPTGLLLDPTCDELPLFVERDLPGRVDEAAVDDDGGVRRLRPHHSVGLDRSLAHRANVTFVSRSGLSASRPFTRASAAAKSWPGTTERSGARTRSPASGTGRE